MAERVLVTGALGYLGSILCEHLLDAGYRVKAVDNLMYGVGQQALFHLGATSAFEFVQGDVRDEAFMTGTGAEIMPVLTIDGKAIGPGQPGPVTRRLRSALQDLIRRETSGGANSS